MPWRPWATPSPRLPRPGPGSSPSCDPEASVSTIASPPLPAAAFSPGRRAQRPLSARAPYPWRRRRLGRRVPGPRQQLPSGAQRLPRHLRPGPLRPTALRAAGDAGAVPRRRDGGGGQEPATRRGETGLAELPGVQPDRKKEKEPEGGLGCEEPEGGTLVGPPAPHPPGFTDALRLHFQEDASHVRTFPSAGPAGLTNTPDRSSVLFRNSQGIKRI